MHLFSLLTAYLLSTLVAATPTPRDPSTTGDLQVLNFALTLEHLEEDFYKTRLDKYSQHDFVGAGLPEWTRDRMLQIKKHEQVHADFLTMAIEEANAKAVRACKYQFWDQDPISFSRTSVALGTIGTSLYNGLLKYLQNKDYLTIAGSIITVEARHTGWINSAILKKNPWNTAFDIPLTPRQAYTILSNFIKWCPTENDALLPPGVTNAFPQLTILGELNPGEEGQVKFLGVEKCEEKHYWIVIKTGVAELRSKLKKDGWFFVHKEAAAKGATYVFITSDDQPVSDDNIIAGPALAMFEFDSTDN